MFINRKSSIATQIEHQRLIELALVNTILPPARIRA